MLGSDLYSEGVLILRWLQSEVPLYMPKKIKVNILVLNFGHFHVFYAFCVLLDHPKMKRVGQTGNPVLGLLQSFSLFLCTNLEIK